VITYRRKGKPTANRAHFSPVKGFLHGSVKTKKKKEYDILEQLVKEAGHN